MGNFDVERHNCVIRCVLLLNYPEIWAALRAKSHSPQTWIDNRSHTSIQRVRFSLHQFKVGTFRPERIESIASRYGVDGKQALENILIGKALNSESPFHLPFPAVLSSRHQQTLIDNLGRTFAEERGVYRLLVLSLHTSNYHS